MSFILNRSNFERHFYFLSLNRLIKLKYYLTKQNKTKQKKNNIMNKFEEKVAKYSRFMEDKGLNFDSDLLKAVTKGLGPSIYKVDAETVSGSEAKELATVRNNFLIKKLGLEDSPALDASMAEVLEAIGKSERKKYRAVVYYMLMEKFSKQDVYNS